MLFKYFAYKLTHDKGINYFKTCAKDKKTALKAWFAGAHLGDGSAYEKKINYSPLREKWQQKAEIHGKRLIFKIRAAERESTQP